MDDPPSHEHALQIFRQAFCARSLERIRVRDHDNSGRSDSPVFSTCEKSQRGTCSCISCLILHLSSLPAEILSDFIAPHVTQGCLRRILSICGVTFDLVLRLQELERPSRHYVVSCRHVLFITRTRIGQGSYVTGIYNENVAGSYPIDLPTMPCKYVVVSLDKVGITNIHLSSTVEPPSRPPKAYMGYWMYTFAVADGLFHVQSKVE